MEKIIYWKVIWNFSRERKISKYVISKLLKFKVKYNSIGKILL